jgi:serine/threonine protein kinase HipA of HipAB toxin-antitoxin module
LPGGYRLTPFYDIISAFPVLGGTGLHLRDLKLSMGLNATKGRKTEINAIYPRHFLATAKAVNFPREQMLAILQEFAGHVPQAIERSPDAAGGLFQPRLAGHYREHAEAARPPAARAAGAIAEPAGG